MKSNNIGKLIHIKKLCNDQSHLQMLAIDQRPPIFNLIKNKKKKYTYTDVVDFKKNISLNLSKHSTAILMDPVYSLPNLIPSSKSKGLIITLEDHDFIEKGKGRYSKNIKNWTVEKIKRIGGDAVKVLAWYRPDADQNSIKHQKKYIETIGKQCEKYDIPFLLELLVYPFKNETGYSKDYKEQLDKNQNHVINSVKEFSKSKYKVDIFKLESPVDSSELEDGKFTKVTQEAFRKLSLATKEIPWVMLSSGMSKKSFHNCLKLAYKNGASGYLAGRTIWLDAFKDYPNYKKITDNLSKESISYVKKLNELTKKNAQSLEKYLANKLIQKKSINFKNKYKGF
ncbi:tagatose 1,6-diphosphate aldolase [Alphaproteobacteria bacterium]|nr:tagatose 1,6-diphosphate aldolase [Alphaproteobacteria bacterium]